MNAIWTTIRLIVAERLLLLAMDAAPKNIREGKDITTVGMAYFRKQYEIIMKRQRERTVGQVSKNA